MAFNFPQIEWNEVYFVDGKPTQAFQILWAQVAENFRAVALVAQAQAAADAAQAAAATVADAVTTVADAVTTVEAAVTSVEAAVVSVEATADAAQILAADVEARIDAFGIP